MNGIGDVYKIVKVESGCYRVLRNDGFVYEKHLAGKSFENPVWQFEDGLLDNIEDAVELAATLREEKVENLLKDIKKAKDENIISEYSWKTLELSSAVNKLKSRK